MAEIPACEPKLFRWNKWSMFEFFSAVVNKIEGSLHAIGETVGICSHSKQRESASWEEVLEEVKDLPGLHVVLNLVLTITSFDEKLNTGYYKDIITKIEGKGISNMSIHFKESDVPPYLRSIKKAVNERLDQIFE